MTGDPSWADLREEVVADVRRVSDRLRRLSAAQLKARPADPGPETGRPSYDSRAMAARAVAALLAEAAAALEPASPGEAAAARRHHPLPPVADHALGDVVDVLGKDLLAAMDRVTSACSGPADGAAREVAVRAAGSLADLRRRI